MKRRRKLSKRQHTGQRRPTATDPFDAWLDMLGTLVFEPVTDVFRAAGRLIRSTRQQHRRRSRGDGRRRDKL